MTKKYLYISVLIVNLCSAQDFIKFTIDNSFGFTRGIEVADLNNDIHMDVIALSIDNTPEIAFWLNDGAGDFATKIIIDNTLEDYGGNGDDVTVLDVNNDGYLDVIASVQLNFDNRIVWYENNQNEAFGSANIIATGGRESNDIVIFDVDNNGFDDIVIGYRNFPPNNGNDYSTYYYPNSGNSTFGSRILIDHSFGNGTEVNSFNNDNFKDLVFSSGEVTILTNNGDGTYSSPISIDNSLNPNFIGSGKINNDSFNDIVVSAIGSQETLVWYEGNGDGTFGIKNIISIMEYSQIAHIEVDDIDNDGDTDIAATTFSSSDILWWENLGNGNMSSTKIINAATSGNYDLKIIDIDADGKKDIIVSNTSGVYWFKNDLTLSLEENALTSNKIKVYPNPNNGEIFINSPINIDRIQVYNIIGELVLDQDTKGSRHKNLHFNNAGFYFINLLTSKGNFTKKIMVK